MLLFAYSAGLAVPFIIAGALFTRAMGVFRWLRDHYLAIQIVSGLILVALGGLLFAGQVLRAADLLQPRARRWLGLSG